MISNFCLCKLGRLMNTVFKSYTDQVCEREINLQRSESGKLLDGQRRDSKTKSVLQIIIS